MSLIDQKAKIFGNIAAARVLKEGFPDLRTNPSFPSINNNGDSVQFLVDLLKALVGLERLRDVVVDSLVYKLEDMETSIKTEMKRSLKNLVNCGVDPSIPSYIKSSGQGIKIETSKVDFFNMLKTDPTTSEGNLLYTDTQANPLTSSNDFNTFLFGTIQNDGTTESWGSSPKILDVRFDSINFSPTPNNTLTFNANSDFNNKTLTEFNNRYIDSIDLFDSRTLLNRILDIIFGSVSVQLNKSRSQLKKEEEIKNIIECIINADDNDVIDDSFFTFSNEDIANQEISADQRKKGIRVIHSCGNVATSINPSTINEINDELSSSTNNEQLKSSMTNSLNKIGGEVGNQAPSSKDNYALELNFIENIIQNLISTIVGFILSPKVITIFLLNYKIVYGINEDYDDAADFMRQNKNLMRDIAKAVRNSIINVLLNVVLKEISLLVSATAIEIASEKGKNQLGQILSLVGVPQEVLRLIRGL